MNAKLAYRIRNGKICEPVKGATIVGDGLTVIKNITMVATTSRSRKAQAPAARTGSKCPSAAASPPSACRA